MLCNCLNAIKETQQTVLKIRNIKSQQINEKIFNITMHPVRMIKIENTESNRC